MDGTQAQIITFSVAVFSFLCAGAVVALFLRRKRQLQTWTRVDATVSRAWNENRPGQSGGPIHHVEYTFTTPDGQTRQGKGVTDDEHQHGDLIEVRYDPEDPGRSKSSFSDVRAWYLVGIPVFLMFVGFGVLALLEGLAVIDLS